MDLCSTLLRRSHFVSESWVSNRRGASVNAYFLILVRALTSRLFSDLPAVVVSPVTFPSSARNLLLPQSLVVPGYPIMAGDVHCVYIRRARLI